MSSSKINLNEPPKFLSILGSKGFNYDKSKGIAEMKFLIGDDLTHSNGTIVQGGFITAMLDASMAHLLILKGESKINPLSLNVNVAFLAPGKPGEFVASSKIDRLGKSVAFTSATLHQGDLLIATASATNKLIQLK
ncbi:MAG: PaaI family thioesterase [Gammaproteobacteria bacterium]|uniref:PaaI family thioesterase n=1 Tax=SAR86 cluster bacterium TaxID=2030880 RepID=A0A368BLH5_9GAMM|nr:MAG: PaaI family thioesterase [SAR86 cluster bacterium]|tara:strand:+ start:1647 stop:2054 length:408 start_codon:yes stop_codon:yes gene_type:complete